MLSGGQLFPLQATSSDSSSSLVYIPRWGTWLSWQQWKSETADYTMLTVASVSV